MKKITIPDVRPEDFLYRLPEERIAKFPLEKRDHSKLLHFQNGKITDHQFFNLTGLLTSTSTLFFNNTKVLPARIYFRKETGAVIELFLLSPVKPTHIVSLAMVQSSPVVWNCTIGNLKRWKDGKALQSELEIEGRKVLLTANLIDREAKMVEFSWESPTEEALNFADLISHIGNTPLPPYLNREATEKDKETYQTVYSKKKGAVAAPTAGLHFTEAVLSAIRDKGVTISELTLHVSAGTFKPIKVEHASQHDMHQEQMVVSKQNLLDLYRAESINVVGTTSMRTLESLFWYAVMLKENGLDTPFSVPKLIGYEKVNSTLSRKEAAEILLQKLDKDGAEELMGDTSIFIYPGYQFRFCDGLITNFHQPESTLILLVAAFLGEDWRKVYQHALENDYRFLSYGDSSFLLRG